MNHVHGQALFPPRFENLSSKKLLEGDPSSQNNEKTGVLLVLGPFEHPFVPLIQSEERIGLEGSEVQGMLE